MSQPITQDRLSIAGAISIMLTQLTSFWNGVLPEMVAREFQHVAGARPHQRESHARMRTTNQPICTHRLDPPLISGGTTPRTETTCCDVGSRVASAFCITFCVLSLPYLLFHGSRQYVLEECFLETAFRHFF